ncbi:hypothetical protein RFI_28718 [Reticulomyxa filosa]|uniref:Uncharacterized protein n=1 Tax=Reticulomyxa filosa TaxID=46433 RepID=X6M415_RETFI|nr:hypothetical protein RFI_28718 [Reticulomyxa filosa]|eukprot:ETO08669.1 hypothetical protein RFI_28718 [Reticulomyxa filosa]
MITGITKYLQHLSIMHCLFIGEKFNAMKHGDELNELDQYRSVVDNILFLYISSLTSAYFDLKVSQKQNKKNHVIPRRKEIDLTKIGCALIHHLTQLWSWNTLIQTKIIGFKIFQTLKNLKQCSEIINCHRSEAFEENEKKSISCSIKCHNMDENTHALLC